MLTVERNLLQIALFYDTICKESDLLFVFSMQSTDFLESHHAIRFSNAEQPISTNRIN